MTTPETNQQTKLETPHSTTQAPTQKTMHESLYSAADALHAIANEKSNSQPIKLTGNSTDMVFVKGLKVDAVIGVYEWEQQITQPLIFDIEMVGCQYQASQTDNIEDAINYKSVSERVAEVSIANKVALLERLAQLVAEMILAEFAPEKVTVTIHKPTAIKQADSVGVKITRFQQN
ncbi:MAG: dihydroneopterin aldolase [Moraxella sp.]|nr:dihydroneopterin aldolase [Moraxella sp.]